LSNILIIAGKEFRSYLSSPMAYIVTGIFLLLTGVFFGTSATTYTATSLDGFTSMASMLLLLFASVMTMRIFAEEKKLGTIELLMTAPVRDTEVVLGKYFGSLGIVLAMLALTLYYPLVLFVFGHPDVGPIVTGYIGLVLLGCAAIAVGLFASTLTNNQIVAAVVAGGILFGLWFIGALANFLPASVGNVINYFSLSYYFPDFMKGILDTRGVVYYLSIAVLFLFLSVRSLENSRWN
jgi:ABC-2 type transport system permease protein